MELYPGVYRIESLYYGRNLFQYLLVGERVILIDSGIAETPATTILPYLERLGIDPSYLSMVITTHPDGDHQGGNAALKKSAPRALFACGDADRQLVESPYRLQTERYNHLAEEYDIDVGNEPSPDYGKFTRVDIGFRGGEHIAIGNDWELEVLHVPGHSQGHLALYDARNRTAFVSDAIHGHGCPGADGSMKLPVTYYHINLYVSTLQYLESLQLRALHTGHWPAMRDAEITDFIADSRHTVERLDSVIVDSLDRSSAGRTLKDLIEETATEFPEWPADTRIYAAYAFKGHLDRLEARGVIRRYAGSLPVRWEIVR